jgi:hypothetical protein
MNKRNYVWFIEPLDSGTNETISQELPEMNFWQSVICEDGRKHNLWSCDSDFVSKMRKSKRNLNLNFKIFNQRDGSQIRECKFLYPKKRKK